MAEPMSDERLAELYQRTASSGLDYDDAADLLAEVERLRGERDADTDAVQGVLVAINVLRIPLPAPAARRVTKLRARFAHRIAAFNAETETDR